MLKILLIAAVVATASGAGSPALSTFEIEANGYGFHLIGESKDCCRYNGAGFDPQHSRNYNGAISKCEEGCRATETCKFFSHHMKYGGTCVLCSKCDFNTDKKGKIYNSYELVTPPATNSKLEATPPLAPTPPAKSDLIATGQDCCRYNDAQLCDSTNDNCREYNGFGDTGAGEEEYSPCQAGCQKTATCNFFSHNKYGACVLCSKCNLNGDKKGKVYNSYEMKPEATVVPKVSVQEVSFEIEVVGLTVADVQSSLQTYAQALADALDIDVARISLSISTSRRLVEGNTGVTIVATVTASDTDTATASVVEAAVTAPTFATSVVTELQTAGVTVVLTVDTDTISVAAASCSVQCSIDNDIVLVTHDTTSGHSTHRCYKDDTGCTCKCA